MTITLQTLQLSSGVPVEDGVGTPVGPTLTPVTGKDQLRVQWSKESGLPSQFEALYRITATDDTGIREVSIDWGDGSELDYISGFGASPVSDDIFHTYTISVAIVHVEFETIAQEVFGANFSAGISLDTRWTATQFKIERYKMSENFSIPNRRFVTDWRDIDTVKSQDDFIDYRVDRLVAWGYRVRFRQLTDDGVILGTTDWSPWSVQTPWS